MSESCPALPMRAELFAHLGDINEAVVVQVVPRERDSSSLVQPIPIQFMGEQVALRGILLIEPGMKPLKVTIMPQRRRVADERLASHQARTARSFVEHLGIFLLDLPSTAGAEERTPPLLRASRTSVGISAN